MPRKYAACGTLAAYQRHHRNGEPVDAWCQRAGTLGRAVTATDMCICAGCCCDQGGGFCRQTGCEVCLTAVWVPAPRGPAPTVAVTA